MVESREVRQTHLHCETELGFRFAMLLTSVREERFTDWLSGKTSLGLSKCFSRIGC